MVDLFVAVDVRARLRLDDRFGDLSLLLVAGASMGCSPCVQLCWKCCRAHDSPLPKPRLAAESVGTTANGQ